MKAILQYGQFTTIIQLPDIMSEISIPKPVNNIAFLPLEVADITEIDTKVLHFRYKTSLNNEYHLYDFWSEG